ncbi:DUF1365 domain-containing protein [Pseudonocardia sp. CA-107938]|uniref:DUF1365 domain-containing protein n=1 Tax=Pseudonocardia sp. CA-107938 TaxID=3240021 RepID=UPI003D925768
MVTPALYDCTIRHVRRQGMHRAFRHGAYLWLVDLDDLPRLPPVLRPFAGFAARDHLGDPTRTIRQNLDAWLATRGIDLAGGRVLMLAHARVLGHVFNPITVYWCHRPGGELACVVAEVHNTYGERHSYLLTPDAGGRARTAKEFYVSPFLTVEGEYRMLLREPDERLALSVSLCQGGRAVFSATVTGVRRPAGPRDLVRMLVRRPFMPHRTSALIRRHGVALWLRRLPVVPRRQEEIR